jgi:hypothetical protein
VAADGSWSVNMPAADADALTDGIHLVTVDVSDKAGNAATQATRNVTAIHNFFKVAIRNAIPDIKENRIKNNVLGKMSPFKTDHNLIL